MFCSISGVVQFYPWFNFYFPLFLCMVMYDNGIKQRKVRIEPRIKFNHNISIPMLFGQSVFIMLLNKNLKLI